MRDLQIERDREGERRRWLIHVFQEEQGQHIAVVADRFCRKEKAIVGNNGGRR